MQQIKPYLLSKPEAVEERPFRMDVDVFKVKGKMFATLSLRDGVPNMNLKCDQFEAVMLRDIFTAVLPGYHMNKSHWNTIVLDSSIPDSEVRRMIDNSYGLVIKGLPKAERSRLETRYTQVELYGRAKAP